MILKNKSLILYFLLALTGFAFSSVASAYSCNRVFTEANILIKKAEGMVNTKTDSRILSILEEAKGIAKAGLISHSKASQNHHGLTGKYAHSDSVRKGRWAVSLAKQALFLLSGKPQ